MFRMKSLSLHAVRQVEVEKRFMDLDEQEQRNRLNEDMEPEPEATNR